MKLIFAVDHRTGAGRRYKAGSTHEVNDQDARALLYQGIARKQDLARGDDSGQGSPNEGPDDSGSDQDVSVTHVADKAPADPAAKK